jgi:hypothetical protein
LSIASQQGVLEYQDARRSMIRPYRPLTVVEIDESTVESNGENLEEIMRALTFTPEQVSEFKILTSHFLACQSIAYR